jgi:hypothetical protein
MNKKFHTPIRKWCACAIFTMLTTYGVVIAQPPYGPPKASAPDELVRAIGGPTLITLKFTDARPELVFASLAKQAGVHLHAYESTDLLKKLPPMTVDMKDVPCMVALKTLASKLGLIFTLPRSASVLEESPTGLTLRLQVADDSHVPLDGPTLVRGPFVIIATSVQRAHTLRLSEAGEKRAPAARQDFRADFVILADPKLLKHELLGAPTFSYEPEGWEVRSVDRERIWTLRDGVNETSPLEWRYSAHRRVGPSDQTKTLTFKATAGGRALVTTKTQTWEVSDILAAKNVSKEASVSSQGRRRYTIHEIKRVPNTDISRRGEMYQVSLWVSGIGLDEGRWGWPKVTGNHLIESFRLVDAEGRDFEPYGPFAYEKSVLSGIFWSGRARGVGKAAVGPPTRMIWTLPTEIRAIQIPIEFTGLPVP